MKNASEFSKEAEVSLIRSLFSAVPIIGQALNEAVFELRGRVKQERLNKFTEMFAEYFIGKTEFDVNVLKTEDFGDLLEAVLKNVVQTKSEAKYIRYKNILLNQIENPLAYGDNSIRHLDLVSVLNEIEISILHNHRFFDESFKIKEEQLYSLKEARKELRLFYNEQVKLSQQGYANDRPRAAEDLNKMDNELNELERDLSEFSIYREASFYQISHNQFMYHKQNLYSKALLTDSAAGGDSYGYIPFAAMSITEFGKDFLSFLISKK